MLHINKTYQNLIPALSAEEYAGLEASIQKEGLRDAIVTLVDGTIIDGHNRYKICTEHNIPYHTVTREFENEAAIEEWIIRNQLSRRNLPLYVQGELLLKLKSVLAATAKAKQISTLKQNMTVLANSPKRLTLYEQAEAIIETKKQIEKQNTRETLAKAANIGSNTIGRIQKIQALADEETKRKLRNGEMSINQAYNDVRKAEKKAAVQQKIDEHAAERTGIVDLSTVKKKYSIIYADPAWQYWEGGQKNQSLHYSTMSIDDICALPVEKIADDNAVLFLWVTYPILQDAFKVIEAWGFKYSTCAFVWVKRNKNKDSPFFGCGAWTRANSELCLLATRGTMTRLDASISQVIEAPIEEHSRKPAETREKIERLVGKLPRIELFSREQIDGWDVWGNEI